MYISSDLEYRLLVTEKDNKIINKWDCVSYEEAIYLYKIKKVLPLYENKKFFILRINMITETLLECDFFNYKEE